MKRFAIIFNGVHWSIPKWLLNDRSKEKFAYFNDYKLAKLVRQFYEYHPELDIPDFPDGWTPLIRSDGERFIAITAYPQLDYVKMEGDNFHTLMLDYAMRAREVYKPDSSLLPFS